MPCRPWLAAALVCLGATALPAAEKPNVVFILADDLGVNDLGCYGRKDHNTPQLDRLARAGALFTQAYASCPVCSPTRAALMTGKNPARLHITTFLPGRGDAPSQKLLHPQIITALPAAERTLPECLKDVGYATGCFGKWHLGGKGSQPTDHGFDVYHAGKANTEPTDAEGGKGEYDLTAKAAAFAEQNAGRPFFLYLAHHTPHIPYTAKPVLVTKNADAHEPTYAAVIESMDDSVGVLLKKLDDLKLAENTIVVFTSDNGGLHVPELRHQRITHNAPYRAGKGFLYEGGIRVPLIVRWPGTVKPGTRIDTPVITHDWLPTIVTATGGTVPVGLDGVSILPLLTGSVTIADRALFWHIPHYTNQGSRPAGAVRSGKWMLIQHYEDDSVELFDLSADVGETTNVAADHPKVAADLAARLAAWRKDVGAQENTPNPAFRPDLHRALYLDTDPSKYNSAKATPAEFARMQEWRKGMDAVVPKKNKK